MVVSRTLGAALCAALLGSGACYRYIPTEVAAVPAGENVRVYVSRSVLADIEEALPGSGPVLQGRIARREDEHIFLRVPVSSRQVGFHSALIEQEVPIPAREITQLERRQLDRIGTGGVIAGTFAAAGVVFFVIMETFLDQTVEEECPECADLRAPFLSFFRR